jgi:hypothetical protein
MSNQQQVSLYVRAALDILSCISRFMYLLCIKKYQYIQLCNVELSNRGRGNGKNMRGGGPNLIKATNPSVTFEE